MLRAMFGLDGRVGLVTGASHGIGRGIATALTALGARTLVASRDIDDLRDVCDHIARNGGEASPVALDLTSMWSIDALADAVTNAVGERLDFLVNNAGTMTTGSLGDVTEGDWHANVDVNLKGTIFCTRALLGHLRRSSDARVVNIASIHALIGVPDRSIYAAAKGGLVALTRQLAVELGPEGITVNAVCPGVVPTRLNEERLGSAEHRSHLIGTLPLRRFGTPEDVAGAVAYLCAPAGGYATGQVIAVDGGWSVT